MTLYGTQSPEGSSSGEDHLPKYDFTGICWSPEPPAGLHFLSLVPVTSGYETSPTQSPPSSSQTQHDLVRKMKVKHKSHRPMVLQRKAALGKDVLGKKAK